LVERTQLREDKNYYPLRQSGCIRSIISHNPEYGWHSLKLLSKYSEWNAFSQRVVKLGSPSAIVDCVSDVASNTGGLSIAGTNSWENINRKDHVMHALCFIFFMKKCSSVEKCRPKGRKWAHLCRNRELSQLVCQSRAL